MAIVYKNAWDWALDPLLIEHHFKKILDIFFEKF